MSIVEIPWVEPAAMAGLLSGRPWGVLLDSGGPCDARGRWSFLCRDPVATLVSHGGVVRRCGDIVEGDVFDHLREMAGPGRAGRHGGPPFAGGVVGLASYGLGLAIERVASRHADAMPDLVAASYADVLAFDRLERRCWWCSETGRAPPAVPEPVLMDRPPCVAFLPERDAAAWMAAVEDVRALIAAGEIFQANLTMRWQAPVPDGFDDIGAYLALREAAPAPFGALLRAPGLALLSASVERFVALSGQGEIETRPIKGTAPPGPQAARSLAMDAKERAENLMITDLMRNDIGRVCALGSVTVPQLAQVEQFASLAHLVSSVRGRLRDGCDAVDLLRATLPPGSVTGAPKRRAMAIIDAIETSPRGAYCGSVFRIGRDGAMDSSVVIRSVARLGDRLSIGAGGGITHPSDPAAEYAEMLLKAAPLLRVFGA